VKYQNAMGATPWATLSPLHLWTPQTMVGSAPRLCDGKLTMSLSERLFQDRRIVQLHVRALPGHRGVELFFKSLGLFDMPRPGQYAWQRPCDGASQVQFPLRQAFGDVSYLQALLRRSGAVSSYARVTPEGVTVRIMEPGHRIRVMGEAPTRMVDELLEQAVRRFGRVPTLDVPMVQSRADAYRYASFLEFGVPALPPHKFIPLVDVRCAFPSLVPPAAEEDRKDYPMTAPAGTRIVNCQFAGIPQAGRSKTYAYYTADQDIAVGDYVNVVSPYDGQFNERGNHFEEALGGHLVVVKVVSVEETVESIERAAKWVVSRIDVTAYAERQAKQERRQVLLAKVRKLEKEARARMELDKLRELSPELATAIDELSELGA
jgi:hypothetical protein